ncbi:hypothetical protein HK099_001248, partial [Clydaea vesicula]
MPFTEQEFLDAILSRNKQISEDYKLSTSVQDIKVFSNSKNKNLNDFKVSGSINEPFQKVVDFYHDLNFRKEWDSFTHSSTRLACIVGSSQIFNWVMKYTFPWKNREYFYEQESKTICNEEGTFHVILAKNYLGMEEPVKDGNVKVTNFHSTIVLWSNSENDLKTLVFAEYLDDPQGSFNETLINKAIK